jgi:hypothetical protein
MPQARTVVAGGQRGFVLGRERFEKFLVGQRPCTFWNSHGFVGEGLSERMVYVKGNDAIPMRAALQASRGAFCLIT